MQLKDVVKHSLYLKVAICFLLSVFYTANVSAYTKLIVDETPLETPPTNWNASDDATILVNIGFTFPYGSFGNMTQIRINSNGALSNTAWNAYFNQSLPRTNPTAIIAPYWDDINRPQGGTIRYGTLGTAPNRRFIVAWTNTPRYFNNGDCTFQTVLYENGDIRFRYSTANIGCSGNSATVGIQETTTIFDQHSFNSGIDLSKDILYTNPLPAISLQKTSAILSDPINGTVNPKAIPGAVGEYTILASNAGAGATDNNSIVLTDAIPANTALYVNDISGAGTGPVRFIDGSTSSGLNYTYTNLGNTTDGLSFSNDNGASYAYTPSADADGVDTNVTNIQISTTGQFLGSTGATDPSFTVLFRVRVQ